MDAQKRVGRSRLRRLIAVASLYFACIAPHVTIAGQPVDPSSHTVFKCEVNGQTILTDRMQDASSCKALQISPINGADAQAVKPDREREPATSGSKHKRVAENNKVARNDDSIALLQIRAKQRCEKMAQQLEDIDDRMRAGVKLKQQEQLRERQRDISAKRTAEHCR